MGADNKTTGFTIVELLIVVVVIAILAAITIVSYNGITNRSNDSAVQSDIATMSKKLQLYYVDNNKYPSSVAELATVGLNASNSAYAVSPTVNINLGYCYSDTPASFALFGMSKSGKRFMTKDGAAVAADTTGAVWDASTTTLANQCTAVGVTYPVSHGYLSSDGAGPWRAWAGGN